MRWRTTLNARQQICLFLLFLVTIYGSLGQNEPTAENGEISMHEEANQNEQSGQRKDLNELPEMRKAKELRTEAERAEIEAERMRELAKLEAELKAKDETTTEMAKHELMGRSGEKLASNSNETTSEEGGVEEVVPSSEIGAETAAGEGQMEDGMKQEGDETAFSQNDEPKTEEGLNNTSEMAMEKDEQKEAMPHAVTGSLVEGENVDSGTVIQFQQQPEALITTHSSRTTRLQGEEELTGPDDPFQTSSTSAPSNNGEQTAQNGGGEKQEEEHEEHQGHETEHEVIQQTVHVHQPNGQNEGGMSGGGEDQNKELAMPEIGDHREEKNTTQSSEIKMPNSSEIDDKKEDEGETKEEKSGEENKEDTEMNHEINIGENPLEMTTILGGGILSGAQHSSIMPSIQGEFRTAEPEEAKEEKTKFTEAENEATKVPPPSKEEAEEHPIIFPAAHLPDDQVGQTQQPPTTEELVIAGDKSIFEHGDGEKHLPEPEKAKIQLMSHEGELKESNETEKPEEQQQQKSTSMPPLVNSSVGSPMTENEGSDGFELITKEEHEDSTSNGEGGTSEKPKDAKEIAEEEEAEEILPTPADEATQQPMEGMGGGGAMNEGGEADKSDSSVMPLQSTTMIMVDGHEHEKVNDGMENATTMMIGPIAQQTIDKMEADTSPERGDLPGVFETSHPMDETTTMEAPKLSSQQEEEDKSANEVQEPETTSEAMLFPVPTTSMSPEQFELAKTNAHRTPFSLRLPDIEWRPEFEDIESGATKKLREQLADDLRAVLAAATGPMNPLIDFQISSLRPGSVIVEGEMLTREEVADPQSVVSSLEQAILAKGGMLGGNAIDTDQLSVKGQMPSGSISTNNLMSAGQQKQQQQDATNTGLIIGGAVVVGVLIVVFAIFAIVVFGLNSRRNNCGSMKLSGERREEICMVENGKGRGPFGANGRQLFSTGGTNSANGGGIIPSSGDAAETGNGGVNLMSLRTTAGSNTPTLGQNNPNYGHQNGGTAYANGSGSGARP